MSETHFKKLLNPNYLGEWDFAPGQDKILTIKKVEKETVVKPGGQKEEKPVCHWVESEKPMIMNSTNLTTIAKIMKDKIVEHWSGRKIQIYFDPTVRFGNDTPGGLRIRKTLPEESSIACEECGQFISPAFNMTVSQLAAYTKKKYGKCLCAECAQSQKKGEEKDETEQQ